MKIIKEVVGIKDYTFLLKQLIAKDFKIKYKRSVLGILWSLLNPLFTMIILSIVFSNLMRFGNDSDNFLVYLLTGLVMYNFMSEATMLAMGSVVNSFSLITKVYVPKYIFPLSKVLFIGINFFITLIPLIVMIIVTGEKITVLYLLLPYVFICLFFFALGLGLFLAAFSVFFRDMFYIYNIITLMWTYLTPLFYPKDMITNHIASMIIRFNPMFQYIHFARSIILYNAIPTSNMFLYCGISALLTIVTGYVFFYKTQNRFLYYI